MSVNNVQIFEVGPRDGLQNEKQLLPTSLRVEFIERLVQCGLKEIEIGALVSPKWVPQMADSNVVYQQVLSQNAEYTLLIPNHRGYNDATDLGAAHLSTLVSASEVFSQKNTNRSIAESIQVTSELLQYAKDKKQTLRVYLSCAIACPYEGRISPVAVAEIVKQLLAAGANEIVLSDTIGVGSVGSTNRLFDEVLKVSPSEQLSLHFHDTYGQALTCVQVGIDYGIKKFDSAVAGLGGCPYANGASGNLATEDLVYLLEDQNISTGVDLDKLIKTGQWISDNLQRCNGSKVGLALH